MVHLAHTFLNMFSFRAFKCLIIFTPVLHVWDGLKTYLSHRFTPHISLNLQFDELAGFFVLQGIVNAASLKSGPQQFLCLKSEIPES